MRAAVVKGPRKIEFVKVGAADLGPADVAVDISLCGICGTDVHAYVSGQPISPGVFGHEWTGVIAGVGRDSGYAEGERVAVSVGAACGSCTYCNSGHTGACTKVYEEELGIEQPALPHGGFADQLVVPARRVLRLPDDLSDVQAALIEPATVAYRAVRRSLVRLGDTVVVQGAGPIGLLVLQWLRLAGAAQIIVVEPVPGRAALAADLGSDAVITELGSVKDIVDSMTEGRGADVVFECTGIEALTQSAVDLVRRGGSVMLVGFPDGLSEIGVASWLLKEVTVTTSLGYAHDDFEQARTQLAAGRIDVTPLHSQTVPLDQLGTVLTSMADGVATACKILVTTREQIGGGQVRPRLAPSGEQIATDR